MMDSKEKIDSFWNADAEQLSKVNVRQRPSIKGIMDFCHMIIFTLISLSALAFLLLGMFFVSSAARQHGDSTDNIMDIRKTQKWSMQFRQRPPYSDKAKTARFVVHNSDWGTLATNSLHLHGYPSASLVSVSDGLISHSTGIAYMYLSPMAPEVQDTRKDGSVTLLVTEAAGKSCIDRDIDFEDPRCAKILLVGKFVPVKGDELEFAKTVYFARHPRMRHMPPSHEFFFCKLDLTRVEVLDFFGGAAVVTPEEYYAANL